MTHQLDNNESEATCLLLQEMLGVVFPDSYREFLTSGGPEAGYAGSVLSWELDSVLGATEFLRAARSDLPPHYVVLRFTGDTAVCLDLSAGSTAEPTPVVSIDLDADKPPIVQHPSLDVFLQADRTADQPTQQSDQDEWFQNGLVKLDKHMRNLSFEYKHDKGGQIPRSHLWRPYRFCVQDIILGITVIRHNRTTNSLDVDVFLTATIPEYEPDSGCRALTLILLADAYKSGGSMEIRFTRDVEGGRVPCELVALAKQLDISFTRSDQGCITPEEAKRLFLALSGFAPAVIEKISSLEDDDRLSSASVCYAMHHGIWTAEEVEIILALSLTPETVLANGPGPEIWHLFHHDLLIGRTAMFGSYLDRHFRLREHQPADDAAGETVIELEDDERLVSIGFDPEYCTKVYRLAESEAEIRLPWLEDGSDFSLEAGAVLRVLLRAREVVELGKYLLRDIEQAMEVVKKFPGESVGIMVPADFQRLEPEQKRLFREQAVGKIHLLVCPEFVNQLDLAVVKRLDSVKVMRK